MRAVTLVVVLSLAVVPGLLAAQEEPEESPELQELADEFSEQIEVELVNVDVWVTDRGGRPVPGLEREDFRLFEDGEPVEITHFSGLRPVSGPPSQSKAAPREELAPWEATAEEPVPTAEDERPLHLVIFVDGLQLRPHARERVLQALDGFLRDEVDRTAGVMLAVHDGNGVVMEDFTSDREALARTLERFERLSASGAQLLTERRQVFQEIRDSYEATERAVAALVGEREEGQEGGSKTGPAGEQSPFAGVSEPCTDNWVNFSGLVSGYAQTVTDRSERSVRALATVAHALAGVSGRKTVLYVGGGLERQPGYDLFQFLGELCPHRQNDVLTTARRFDLTPVYEQLTAIANDAGATFYVLEAEGVPVESDNVLGGERFRPSASIAQIRRQNVQDALFQVADQTGGRAIFDAATFERPLAGLARDLGAYYSLGFTPRDPGDGERHRLRVEVDGKYRVRHRQSYRDKPYELRLAERVMAVLQAGAEENALGARAGTGKIEPLGQGTFRVPLEIRVPLEHLTLVSEDGKLRGQVRVVLWVNDEGGGVRPLRQKIVSIEIDAQGAGDGAKVGGVQLVEVGVDLPRGEHRIAVGLRDEIGGGESYLGVRFRVDPSPWQTAEALGDDG